MNFKFSELYESTKPKLEFHRLQKDFMYTEFDGKDMLAIIDFHVDFQDRVTDEDVRLYLVLEPEDDEKPKNAHYYKVKSIYFNKEHRNSRVIKLSDQGKNNYFGGGNIVIGTTDRKKAYFINKTTVDLKHPEKDSVSVLKVVKPFLTFAGAIKDAAQTVEDYEGSPKKKTEF